MSSEAKTRLAHRSPLIAQHSTLRSTPKGDAFKAKRRKNAHPSTLIAQRSTHNVLPLKP
ncbi:hypothetical protein [Prevotella koreensis]